jgi:hypothetical protein
MKRLYTSSLVVLTFVAGGCFRSSETITQQAETSSAAETKKSGDPQKMPPLESSADSAIGDAKENVAEKEEAVFGIEIFREAQALFKSGQLAEGYELALKAKEKLIEEEFEIAWLILESIVLEDKRIDVHLNLGERERELPENGIVRPLSFRVWTLDDDPEILQIIDFEIGRMQGKSMTAALGAKVDLGRVNFGMLEVDDSYETIRQRVLDLVTER